MSVTERLEGMIAAGQDSAVLRFGLATAYLGAGEPARAVEHFRRAVELDGEYSAAWKGLGKALAATGATSEAAEAYSRGIEVAESKGDVQAVKEMRVFLKRLSAP